VGKEREGKQNDLLARFLILNHEKKSNKDLPLLIILPSLTYLKILLALSVLVPLLLLRRLRLCQSPLVLSHLSFPSLQLLPQTLPFSGQISQLILELVIVLLLAREQAGLLLQIDCVVGAAGEGKGVGWIDVG
jgi:hypothetical protein